MKCLVCDSQQFWQEGYLVDMAGINHKQCGSTFAAMQTMARHEGIVLLSFGTFHKFATPSITCPGCRQPVAHVWVACGKAGLVAEPNWSGITLCNLMALSGKAAYG